MAFEILDDARLPGGDVDDAAFSAYHRGSVVASIATVALFRLKDFAQQSKVFVTEKGAVYVWRAASVAADDGDAFLHDLAGRVYEKIAQTAIGVRELLAADRTYYVDPAGSDANDGRTALTAMATLQKAFDTICTLDLGGYTATISCVDGTYAAGLNIDKAWVGGNIVLSGSTAAIIAPTSGSCINHSVPFVGQFTISGMKLTAIGSGGRGISSSAAGLIAINGTEFGACTSNHIYSGANGSVVRATGNYSISGGASYHWTSAYGGFINVAGRTITLTGTPAFTYFAQATGLSAQLINGNTFSGAATGGRYVVQTNAYMQTAGGGASYLPGSTAGTTSTGGIYS